MIEILEYTLLLPGLLRKHITGEENVSGHRASVEMAIRSTCRRSYERHFDPIPSSTGTDPKTRADGLL